MESVWKSLCEDREQIQFKMEAVNGPYKEAYYHTATQIIWNGFFRYGNIFAPLLENKAIEEDICQCFYDILLHYLVEIEFQRGITKAEFENRIKQKQLQEGAYGDKIKQLMQFLRKEEKSLIAHFLNVQERNGTSVALFTEVVLYILGEVMLYWQPHNRKNMILCMDRKQNRRDERMIELLQELFLPLNYSLCIYWEGHVAVIGEIDTMRIEQIHI